MKVRFDGLNKHIVITDKNLDGVIDLDVKEDIYSSWKEWMLQGNTHYLPALRTVGGDPISDTVDVAPYFFLQNGWYLAPSGSDFTVNLTGNLYTDPASAVKVDTVNITGKVLIETNLSNNALQVTSEGSGGLTSAQDATLTQISTDMKRALGLLHENIFIDNTTYDSDNNLVGARIRIYNNSTDIGTNNNVLAKYEISSNGSGAGKFTTWTQVLSGS